MTSPTANSIGITTAVLEGNVIANGTNPITVRGILYAPTSVNANPALGGKGVVKVIDADTTTGVFADTVSRLTRGIAYSYVAFVTTSSGTSYTPVESFTTLVSMPTTPPHSLATGTTASKNSIVKTSPPVGSNSFDIDPG